MVPVGAAFCSEAPSSPSVEKVIINGWVVAVKQIGITKIKNHIHIAMIGGLNWVGKCN